MRGLFVTGTDTGVGKTLVACALLAGLRRAGFRTAAMKPVASGSEWTSRGLRNEDATRLAAQADCRLPYEFLNPYVFQPPVAPHIAAREAGVRLEMDHLLATYHRIAAKGADFCVVEGAGGWLVPLNEEQTLADLVVELDLPVMLVVGMRLGCLNHALLTAESIQARGVRLAGWVANQIEPDVSRLEANIETLRRRLPAPLLGTIRYRPAISPEAAAGLLDVSLLEGILLEGKNAGLEHRPGDH